MRRILISIVSGLLLSQTSFGAAHADPAPQVVDNSLPPGLTGGSTSFDRGPDGVQSGAGSLALQSLTDLNATPILDYTHYDAWIHVPAGTSASLVLTWTCCGTGDVFVLKALMTSSSGWNHFQLLPGTPLDFYYNGAYQYSNTWSYFQGFPNGTITSSTIGLSGSGPAHLDTLTTGAGASYDFEPVQQPTISSSSTKITYGQPVTITGTVLDGAGTPWSNFPATLSAKPAGALEFQDVDVDVSSASGRLASQENPTRTTSFRWSSPSGNTSATRTVKVAPDVRAKIPTKVARGKKLVVTGKVTPALPGLSVHLLRSGSGKPLATTPLKKDGTYRFALKAPRGTYLLSTRTAATTGYVPGQSKQVLVAVR